VAKITTTVTTTITEPGVTDLTLSETQTVDVTGNPRYWAQAVYLGGEEVTARIKAMVENRHGVTPDGYSVLRSKTS
jgi:hypothetical protein